MTVREVYAIASAFIGDKENDDTVNRDLTIPYMNVLLQEAFNCENSIRAMHGEPLLQQAPYVSNLDNGLIYHDELVRAAFPYGLAWQYHQTEGDMGLASQYRNMFVEAVNINYCFSVRGHK